MLDISLIPIERIARTLLALRNKRVILDSNLVFTYGVPTKQSNQAVKRNAQKLPAMLFLFPLTQRQAETLERLKSQIASLNAKTKPSQLVTASSRGLRRYLQFAFTVRGTLMVTVVLDSLCAVARTTYTVSAFIKMRHAFSSCRQLAQKLAKSERNLPGRSNEQQNAIVYLLNVLKKLAAPPRTPRRITDFALEAGSDKYQEKNAGHLLSKEIRTPTYAQFTVIEPSFFSVLEFPAYAEQEVAFA